MLPWLQSGARINISDASCPERIVTVMGTTQQIVEAFSMICHRFEEVGSPTAFTALSRLCCSDYIAPVIGTLHLAPFMTSSYHTRQRDNSAEQTSSTDLRPSPEKMLRVIPVFFLWCRPWRHLSILLVACLYPTVHPTLCEERGKHGSLLPDILDTCPNCRSLLTTVNSLIKLN